MQKFFLVLTLFFCGTTALLAQGVQPKVGDRCMKVGVTTLAEDLTTTVGCFPKTAGLDCAGGTALNPNCVYKQMTAWPSNESACKAAGMMMQWDDATKKIKCVSINELLASVIQGTCGDGTLMQWDAQTKQITCKPIYEATRCMTKEYNWEGNPSTDQTVIGHCNEGYNILAASCWRVEGNPGTSLPHGEFIGDRVSKTEYSCRWEGAKGVRLSLTCCK